MQQIVKKFIYKYYYIKKLRYTGKSFVFGSVILPFDKGLPVLYWYFFIWFFSVIFLLIMVCFNYVELKKKCNCTNTKSSTTRYFELLELLYIVHVFCLRQFCFHAVQKLYTFDFWLKLYLMTIQLLKYFVTTKMILCFSNYSVFTWRNRDLGS